MYDYIVIGSGPGGATVARELARKRKNVLVLEAGPEINEQDLGNFWPTVFWPGYYKNFAAFALSFQGSTIYHTKNVGGTSVFGCGNFVRSMEAGFRSRDIDLAVEFKEAEDDIGVAPLDSSKIITGSKAIMDTARQMGYVMQPMPKGGPYRTHCSACGDCVLGCAYESKWDARDYMIEAKFSGAKLLARTRAKKIRLNKNGEVLGVETNRGFFEGNRVVLSAGGLNTPVILQQSGIDAGQGLFVDYFNATYGIVDKMSQVRGASMAAVDVEYHDKGFLLSPYIDHWSQMLLWRPCWYFGHLFPQKRMLGIMAKISDDRRGRVYKSGCISKTPTRRDRDKLSSGAEEAAKILRKIGARSITTTQHARGAHPGGTAAVDEVLNRDLSVKGCNGLWVCDASVFPETPGLPPTLTIVALGKWLAKRI